MSRKPTQHKPDPRQRLLAAAGPVFAERGFDRATLREICSAAAVNVAAVAYYFGDKMGLYREVIQLVRQSRERRFPAPDNTDRDEPNVALLRLVRTMLSRMLNCDSAGWETQLLMREMDHPTAVFPDMVNEFFRPTFDQLVETLRRLMDASQPSEEIPEQEIPQHLLHQLALSTVGQCLYYRIGRDVVDVLIPENSRRQNFDIDSLSKHVTAVMIAATRNLAVIKERIELDFLAQPASAGTSIESASTPQQFTEISAKSTSNESR